MLLKNILSLLVSLVAVVLVLPADLIRKVSKKVGLFGTRLVAVGFVVAIKRWDLMTVLVSFAYLMAFTVFHALEWQAFFRGGQFAFTRKAIVMYLVVNGYAAFVLYRYVWVYDTPSVL